MSCVRCGSEQNIERDHIKQQVEGGSDCEWNLRDLCEPCHKFRHAYRKIKEAIVLDNSNQPERLSILKHRLEVLIAFNTPELTFKRGTFKSYWDDPTTHRFLPTKIRIPKPIKKFESFKQSSFPLEVL